VKAFTKSLVRVCGDPNMALYQGKRVFAGFDGPERGLL
jgi:hypothetical protein